MKWKLKEKPKNYYLNYSKPVKGICKLMDLIKRPNLRIMGIEEEEEVQATGICNTSNKIITENFPKSRENYAHFGTGGLQNTKQTK
jgi:hypothetical protein